MFQIHKDICFCDWRCVVQQFKVENNLLKIYLWYMSDPVHTFNCQLKSMLCFQVPLMDYKLHYKLQNAESHNGLLVD